MPRIKRTVLMTQSVDDSLKMRRAHPTPSVEMTRVPRWLTLEVRKPEHIWATKNPSEITRNRDPAWLGVISSSRTIVGMRGAKMNLDIKVRKNREPRKIRRPILAETGSGTGQSLSANIEFTIRSPSSSKENPDLSLAGQGSGAALVVLIVRRSSSLGQIEVHETAEGFRPYWSVIILS